ncbi:hypothetical protein KO481_15825 [Nocardia sp. NEAU-G5]|uniref:SUKH-4 immunity protein of toxin-antitoxin system n=1 Tax=Nocardia albiluteola TaxID=2842303 RepID=A0ABS6AY57_9NOCA|nr:hypothetical protein [Nocardia albiluteola]MBU3062987.1 hypothetical protein [Nocardia albiluteola]
MDTPTHPDDGRESDVTTAGSAPDIGFSLNAEPDDPAPSRVTAAAETAVDDSETAAIGPDSREVLIDSASEGDDGDDTRVVPVVAAQVSTVEGGMVSATTSGTGTREVGTHSASDAAARDDVDVGEQLDEGEVSSLAPAPAAVIGSAVAEQAATPGRAATDHPPAGGDTPEDDRSRELAFGLARRLAADAPREWTRLDAVFALTTTESVARVFYTGRDEVVEAVPNQVVMDLAHAQRDSTAGGQDGPWWRLILGLTSDGDVEVDYDYGEEPFPADQLFSPEAYESDLDVYPRERLPVWLAAYIDDDGDQGRDAAQAVFEERLDRAAGVLAEAVTDLPALDVLWARWVSLAAVFVATGSELGPRIMPSQGWFEGATHSGSTLSLLPGGRAVLSGGVWEAPALDAAYNDGEELPELYRGAPFWVADEVLNPRAGQGMLSFCYWWDGNGWYRGESPSPAEFARAVPGVWTTEVVTDLIVRRLGADRPGDELLSAATALVVAAEERSVRRELITELLGQDSEFDVDGAYYQFFLAELTEPEPAVARG